MRFIQIQADHAGAALSLREGSRANPSLNMYDAPPLLEYQDTWAGSFLATMVVRSQECLRVHANSTSSALSSIRAYFNDPSVGQANRVASALLSSSVPLLSIGKISPPGEIIRSQDFPATLSLVYSVSESPDRLDRKILAILRYLALLQKKAVNSLSPFYISVRPLKIYRDLLSENLTAELDIQVKISGYYATNPVRCSPASLVAVEVQRTFHQGAASYCSLMDRLVTSTLHPSRMESVDNGNRKSLPGFFPVERFPSIERAIPETKDDGELSDLLDSEVKRFSEIFADPNTALLYCDTLLLILTTLQRRVSYPVEIHSRFT